MKNLYLAHVDKESFTGSNNGKVRKEPKNGYKFSPEAQRLLNLVQKGSMDLGSFMTKYESIVSKYIRSVKVDNGVGKIVNIPYVEWRRGTGGKDVESVVFVNGQEVPASSNVIKLYTIISNIERTGGSRYTK